MMRNGCLLFFLLLHLLLEYAVAMPLAENPLEQNEKTSVEFNGDSVKIYYDLIAEENYDSHYGPNVAGMIVGGFLIGSGTFFLSVAINDVSKNDFASAISVGFFSAISIPFYLVGLPVFLYNTYKFVVRKGHANRRDEYIDTLKRYKERRENSVQWTIVPSVNLANAGGRLNLLVAF